MSEECIKVDCREPNPFQHEKCWICYQEERRKQFIVDLRLSVIEYRRTHPKTWYKAIEVMLDRNKSLILTVGELKNILS